MRLNSLRLRFVITALTGLGAVSPAVVGQQSPPAASFRSGVQLVLVDVVVRDGKSGRLVTDLTKNDFEIEDEGKPQTIASFASVNLPDTRRVVNNTTAATWPVTEHLATNRRENGRLIVFFISDPWIPFNDTGYLRNLLHRFVDRHMRDNDEIAIWPATNQMPRQEFTADRTRLDAVIDRVQGTYAGVPVPPDQLLSSLDILLRRMGAINSRRKVVILLGGEALDNRLIGTPLYEGVLRVAAAANVGIYPMGVTGVVGMSEIIGPTTPGKAISSLLALNVLAQETGGVVANRNDVDHSLERVEEDAGSYYLIGFSPGTVGAASGRLRRLTVKVHRSGTVVQARHGYMPWPAKHLPKPSGAAIPLEDVAAEPLADPQLPLQMQASCFRDGKDGDAVIVTLRVNAPYDRLAGRSLEYSVTGTNSSDQIVDGANGASAIPRATSPVDIGVVSAMHLPPGLVTIKATLRLGNDLTGLVSLNVDVPRLNERLAMSDIALAPMSEHAIVAGNPPSFLTQHLPKPVSAERTFDADDTLAIYGEVYGSQQPNDVTAVATILDAAGHVQRSVALPLAPVPRQSISRSSPVSYSTQLDLGGLDAGAYILGVKVTDAEGHTNAKGIPFQINESR